MKMRNSTQYFKPKATGPPSSLSMKIVTWAKDSHGLFDYESSQLHMKKFESESSCVMYKKGTFKFTQIVIFSWKRSQWKKKIAQWLAA